MAAGCFIFLSNLAFNQIILRKRQRGIVLILLFIFCLSSKISLAQLSLFNFKHLTIDEGLSNNTVYSIIQDNKGFIWAGTRNGLNKFDGFDFTVYYAGIEKQLLAGPTVYSLLQDKAGNIWVGHKEAGVSIIKNSSGVINRLTIPNTLIDWDNITVRNIYQDKSGIIWLATNGDGILGINQKFELIAQLNTTSQNKNYRIRSEFVFDLVEDNVSRLWFVCSEKGLAYYDLKKQKVFQYELADQHEIQSYEKSLCYDKHKNLLWLGTSGSGLFKVDLTKSTIESFSSNAKANRWISNNRVTDIKLDANGQPWLATDGGGLNYFDQKQNRFLPIYGSKKNAHSLNSNAAYKLFFDHAGRLWIGTFNGGINICSQEISPFNTPELIYEKEEVPSILSIVEDADQKIWLGTDGDGLLYIDANKNSKEVNEVSLKNKKFPHRVITSLKSAGSKQLWVGTFAGGLSYFDYQKGEIKNYTSNPNDATSIAHNNVWDIETCINGDLWIATLGGGISHYIKSKDRFISYKPDKKNKNAIVSFQIIDVLLDQNRRYLWAASEDKGLSRLTISTGLFNNYIEKTQNEKRKIVSNNLRCLFQDSYANIWVGTEFNGICIIDTNGNVVKKINTNDGLSSDVVHSINQDHTGFIWVATQKGINRIDPQTLTIIDFGADENLHHNEYNPKSHVELANGNLIFGGTGGISLIDPQGLKIANAKNKIVFSSLKVFNQLVPVGLVNKREILSKDLNEVGAQVNLSYADRAISISFTSNGFSLLNKNRFTYKLEGVDKNWNLLNVNEHAVNFSSLAPGLYTLKVKAFELDNKWGEEASLRIYVSPPFYKSKWFEFATLFFIVCFLISSIAFILHRQRLKFKKDADQANQEILRLKNENLENEIKAKLTEQEILQLQNDGLKKDIVGEKQEQEILKLKNANLEREVYAKKREQEILNLKNENLAKELEAKQVRLSVSLLQTAHKNQFLNDLKGLIQQNSLQASNNPSEIKKVIREINREIDQEDYWEQFQFNFDEMHTDFVTTIKHKHPDSSTNDHRLCCFLLLGLSNREIADILHITINGVEQSKYRLKKKLQIADNLTLNDYIKDLHT